MLDPEGRDQGFELLELGREYDVMAFRKCVVQLTAPLGCALDFELYVLDCPHAYINVYGMQGIPGLVPTAEEEEEQDARAHDAGNDRDHVEERHHYS